MAFDHGCQFFQGGDAEFREKILNPWLKAGLAAEWRGRFAGAGDFFGIGRETVYVGVGGMHTVTAGAAQTLECNHSNFVARRGVRVGAVARAGDRWALSGVGGEALSVSLKSSDVEERVRPQRSANSTPSSSPMRRRPRVLASRVRACPRKPCDVEARPGSGARGHVHRNSRVRGTSARVIHAFLQDSTLWFAARTNSKPGFEASRRVLDARQHAGRAAAEVERVPMRDPATGAFIPQAPRLRGPARALLDAFAAAAGAPLPAHTALHARAGAPRFPRRSRTAATPTAARRLPRACRVRVRRVSTQICGPRGRRRR